MESSVTFFRSPLQSPFLRRASFVHRAANSAAPSQPRRLRLHSGHGAARFSSLWHHRPRSPQPHHPIRGRQHRPRRRHHRLFRLCLGAHAIHFLPHSRRLVRPLRPPPGHPHLLLRPRPRLHLHGPRALPQMAPRRPHHLRHHSLQHLQRLRLRHRRHYTRKTRQAIRLSRRLLRHGIHHRAGRRRTPRRHQSPFSLLGRRRA